MDINDYREQVENCASEARELYQEQVFTDLSLKVKDNPALFFKFSEKVIESFKVKPAEVNIDTGDKSVTILGLSADQCYQDTQKLLESLKSNKTLTSQAENVSDQS